MRKSVACVGLAVLATPTASNGSFRKDVFIGWRSMTNKFCKRWGSYASQHIEFKSNATGSDAPRQ